MYKMKKKGGECIPPLQYELLLLRLSLYGLLLLCCLLLFLCCLRLSLYGLLLLCFCFLLS